MGGIQKMDREDAAFAADTLECRIAGDRDELNARAASSLMYLSTLAAHVRQLADGWPPALAAAAELMAIAKLGGSVCDHPIAGDVQPFIDSMRKLIAAAPIRNRAQRRERASRIRGVDRKLIRAGVPRLVGFDKNNG